MAITRGDIGVVTLVVAMLCAGAAAQSNCTNSIVSLFPCLNYITGNSSSIPSSSCCTQLATVVRSQPQCLCQVLNDGGSSLGLSINRTHALTLPSACKVQTPPISNCNAAASPANSPANSPAGTPGSPTVPSAAASPANSPAGTPGSPTVPSAAASPANSPANSPAKSPANSPANSPASSPANSPANSPAKSPANSPPNSPASSPANSPAGTPGSPTVPSGTGSNTIPSAARNESDGSSTKLPFSLIFFLLFIASYASTFTSF